MFLLLDTWPWESCRNGRLKQHFLMACQLSLPIHAVKDFFWHTTFHHQKKAVESFIIQLAVLELPTKQLPQLIKKQTVNLLLSSYVGHSGYHTTLPYSGKYSVGPNVVLFVLSLSGRKLTHETYIMMGVFSCLKWTERKLKAWISSR